MENENNPTAQEAEVPAPVNAPAEEGNVPATPESNPEEGVGEKTEATPEAPVAA